MSEYNQVDLQIGTEEQFEEKKADLSEGVLVGLTDPIHESELDSDLQTKIDGIKKIYIHNITLSFTVDENSCTAIIQSFSSTNTPYTTSAQVWGAAGANLIKTCSLYDYDLGNTLIISTYSYSDTTDQWHFETPDGASRTSTSVTISDTVTEL